MELFETGNMNSFESMMQAKTSALELPYGGTIELLPVCNMDCKMCYIRMTKEEIDRIGTMLTAEEWIGIGKQLQDAGVLHLLLTGGEPLLYPEFKKVYLSLKEMGFVLTINTNGTLISEEWADFFEEYPPKQLNISLYGPNDQVYQELCNNPNGFTQVMRAVRLLQDRSVNFRFNFNVTPQNREYFEDMIWVAAEHGIPISPNFYMFPPVRKADREKFTRMSPEESARSIVDFELMKMAPIPPETIAGAHLAPLNQPLRNKAAGYSCAAGKNGFWLTWQGELLMCGMYPEHGVSLKEYPFAEAWNMIRAAHKKVEICQECEECEYLNMCISCFASSYTETGSTVKPAPYLCARTKEIVRLWREIAEGKIAGGDKDEYCGE